MPLPRPICVVLHAYSAKNAGDGLLVDETLKLLGAAGVPKEDIFVLASDPDSFSRLHGHVFSAIEPAGNGRLPILHALKNLLWPRAYSRRIQRALPSRPIGLVVGVGGGYLRSADLISGLKTLLVHFPQLAWSCEQQLKAVPVVYLPQSVGPLRGLSGRLVAAKMNRIHRVFVRDDRSRTLVPSSRRAPDLAILALAERFDRSTTRPQTKSVKLIGRELPSKIYRSRLLLLWQQLQPEGITTVTQSSGRGNDDPRFYASMGWPPGRLPETLTDDEASVVVSARLHGSLGFMLRGWPSVHLAYERKGFGAYDDLGVPEYCHNAFDFDVATVRRQVGELLDSPDGYWAKIGRKLEEIKSLRGLLVRELAELWSQGEYD